MIIYIVSFIISLLFFIASKPVYVERNVLNKLSLYRNEKDNKPVYLFLFFSILVLSLLAGLRDTDVGTDVNFYVISDFATAKKYINYFKFIKLNLGREKGYLTLVYLVARITPGNYKTDVNYLLFILSFFTVGIAEIAFVRMRKEISASLALVIYLFMHYNGSYNAVRQYLAESIILLAVSYLKDKEYKKYCLFIFFASLIHSGSIILLVLPIMYSVSLKYKNDRDTLHVIEFAVFLILMVVTWNIRRIVFLLNAIGILDNHYLYYVNNVSTSSNNVETLIYAIEFVFLFFASYNKNSIKDIDFYRIICMLSLVLLQLSRFVFYGNRLSMYFSIINIISICKIPCCLKKGGSRNLTIIVICVITIAYWFYYYIYSNCGETYPYKFK